jgi:hypothetical protein
VPRFYLHIRCDGELIIDDEGADFPDLASATLEACKGARSIMSADILEGILRLDQSIEINDAEGVHVRSVRFAEVINIVRDGEGAILAAGNDP